MIIDKKKKVIATQLRRMITMLVFAIIIILVMLLFNRNNPFLGLTKYNWAILITGIYLVSLIFESSLELNYIYFSDAKNKITLRYFNLSYFNRRKTSIEIPANELVDFEIKKYMWGLKHKLVLQRFFKNQVAKYPPVSITLLNKEERKNLISTLNHYKQKR